MLAHDVQRFAMRKHRKPHKTARLPAYIVEPDTIGTPKDELIVALAQLRVECAYPAPLESLSRRTVMRISGDLKKHYQRPNDPPCRLYSLSLSAISETLNGKRQRLTAFDWVASYVLSCLRHAVGQRLGRRDQGTTVLPDWRKIYALHAAEAVGDAVAVAEARRAYQLPQSQRDFLLAHGPYGEILLARAELGHPHARFRVAVLLACDPGQGGEAVALLLDVASTGHPLALDLLDACRDLPKGAGSGPDADGSLSQVAAQCAWGLARTARGHGADTHARAFFRGAARGGKREAVFELAKMVVTESDPELARWLAQLETEEGTGRHHASER